MAEYTITMDNYDEEVLNSDIPVLLDFWATWCGPCRMLAPVVEEIAEKYEGRVKVGKIDVDDQPELANAFNVSSIPTLVLIKNGEVADTAVGYMPAEKIEQMLR